MKLQYRSIRIAMFVMLPVLLSLSAVAFGQSLTSGDISGTITDASGAAVPNATITLTNRDTGAKQNTTSNSTGSYRFSLLNPGNYTVSATSSGFATVEHQTVVAVGEASTVNVQLQVQAATQTVEVSGAGGVIQTENANISTTISPEMISNVPNPGNDLTYYVQTAPGATMNRSMGYGNTSLFGLPATSNLFTVDGMNENDPFLNVNNSGATNLMLGTNDVQTGTVVSNGYEGQYGGLAGANVNFLTKSGTNKFHGNAQYFWNGRVMNANDWFNNNQGVPRPFTNANQWAASFGGPIIKDKTFFFVNTEGLRLLIPTAQPVNIPSPQFQAATMAHLPASQVPFYTSVFNLYNRAPGASRAANSLPGPTTPVAGADNGNGCDGSVPTSIMADGTPCAFVFQSNIHNLTHEWLITARVDQNFGPHDRAFIHFRTDHGLQATFTDPLNPILNAQSDQPQYEGQFQWNHTVGANGVNQLILAGSWYSAIFQPPNINAAIALMPYQLDFTSGQFATPGGANYATWPQGRNVTQYQIEDDYSLQKGAHNLKFGVNFRRNDLTDYTPGGFFNTIPLAGFASQQSFLAGSADFFQQAFATRPTQPLAVYSLGLYAQDQWSVSPRLRATLSLRVQHNSNPVCVTNCFARLSDQFSELDHNPSTPYNQAIVSGLRQALPSYQNISWEPRLGLAWQPFGNGRTVVRVGGGLFSDIFPGTIATSFDTNSPLKNTFIVPGGAGATSLVPIAPGTAGNAASIASSSNTAFVSGFNSGLNLAQISAAVPTFTPPAVVNSAHSIKYPTYAEWNLEVQQALGTKSSFSINYVGNHGSYLAVFNPGLNAYVPGGAFLGLPAAPPDARFSTVNEVSNAGVSNYNGLIASFTRRLSTSFQVQASFTWSHALDDVSNGGFLPFNFDTNTAILSPQDPYNFKKYNYGNADYDIRKQFNLSYVYTAPKLHGWKDVLANWTVSGVLFATSGLPFTVIDGATTGTLGTTNYGPATGLSVFANSSVGPISCSSSAAFNYAPGATQNPCMTLSQFSPAPAGFGNQRRNQVYGPPFFDTDLTVMKNFRIPHWEAAQLQIGAQAFNILNHPNFDQPVGDIGNPQFGQSIRTVATPTSIFGSFLGADASPRAVQIRAQLQF